MISSPRNSLSLPTATPYTSLLRLAVARLEYERPPLWFVPADNARIRCPKSRMDGNNRQREAFPPAQSIFPARHHHRSIHRHRGMAVWHCGLLERARQARAMPLGRPCILLVFLKHFKHEVEGLAPTGEDVSPGQPLRPCTIYVSLRRRGCDDCDRRDAERTV